MREATAILFLFSMSVMVIAVPFVLIKIQSFSNLNLKSGDFRTTDECEELLNKKSISIEKILNKMKFSYLVIVFMIIDTTFIYEPSLLKAFNQNKVLVCSKEHNKFEVSKNTYQYSNKNRFIKSGQLINKINNDTVDLNLCKIKNKRWWE